MYVAMETHEVSPDPSPGGTRVRSAVPVMDEFDRRCYR